MSFKKFALTGALVAATLSPAFAQAADPCVVATEIDSHTQQRANEPRQPASFTRTKRLVDYRSETVTFQTTITTGYLDSGSAAALQTKSFLELTPTARDTLKKQKPANCQL